MRNRSVRYLSDLTPARRRLVDNIRRLGFGHFERLRVRNGDPVWDTPPDIYSDRKYGSPSQSLPMHGQENCELKAEFVELFAEFDERQDFKIIRLEIQNGLPFRREVKEPLV